MILQIISQAAFTFCILGFANQLQYMFGTVVWDIGKEMTFVLFVVACALIMIWSISMSHWGSFGFATVFLLLHLHELTRSSRNKLTG